MQQYLDACRQILDKGRLKKSRSGDTVGLFGLQMRFDLAEGFPLVTTKKVFTRGIFEELKWLLIGNSNINFLKDQGVNIWNEWATDDGDIGPCYPTMWRHFPSGVPTRELQGLLDGTADNEHLRERLEEIAGMAQYQPIDQIRQLFADLKSRPFSRRHLVSAWSPNVLPDETISPVDNARQGRQALAACHTFFQLYVEPLSQAEAVELQMQRITRKRDAIVRELGGATIDPKRESYLTALEEATSDYLVDLSMKESFVLDSLPTQRLSLQLYQR